MNSKALQENVVVYVALLALFSLVITYQIKSSLETVHVERNYDFFVPFVFQPFTNRINDLAYVLNWEAGTQLDPIPHSGLHRGDEILSVNGRPSRGLSLYLRTLVGDPSVRPASGWHGFTVTARTADSTVRHVEFAFPHCTCGVPSLAEAVSVWVVPPVFCVVLGFATVLWRPKALLAWGFLTALLALSQVQFWADDYTGFQLTSTPMAWGNWLRLFGVGYRALVQSLWPAGLLVASTHFYRRRSGAVRRALGLSMLFLLYAVLRAVQQIAWSENYRPFIALHRFLASCETGFVAWTLIAVAVLSWTLSRRLGVGASGLALTAIITLYWGASPVTHGDWVAYVDGTRRFVFDVPTVHNTPALAITLYVGGMFGLALLVFRPQVRFLEALGCLLFLPLLFDFAARAGVFWYPLEEGFFRYWYGAASALAGIGLACLFWSILKRTAIE